MGPQSCTTWSTGDACSSGCENPVQSWWASMVQSCSPGFCSVVCRGCHLEKVKIGNGIFWMRHQPSVVLQVNGSLSKSCGFGSGRNSEGWRKGRADGEKQGCIEDMVRKRKEDPGRCLSIDYSSRSSCCKQQLIPQNAVPEERPVTVPAPTWHRTKELLTQSFTLSSPGTLQGGRWALTDALLPTDGQQLRPASREGQHISYYFSSTVLSGILNNMLCEPWAKSHQPPGPYSTSPMSKAASRTRRAVVQVPCFRHQSHLGNATATWAYCSHLSLPQPFRPAAAAAIWANGACWGLIVQGKCCVLCWDVREAKGSCSPSMCNHCMLWMLELIGPLGQSAITWAGICPAWNKQLILGEKKKINNSNSSNLHKEICRPKAPRVLGWHFITHTLLQKCSEPTNQN